MISTDLLEKLLAWKKRWGVIHTIDLPSEPKVQTYYYRSLTPMESKSIKELMGLGSGYDWDAVIVGTALLHPASITDIQLPGSINQLSSLILDVSNPSNESLASMIKDARAWAAETTKEQFSINLCLAVCNIYPSISLIDLLQMSTEDLLRIASLIEQSTRIKIFKAEGEIKQAELKPEAQARLGQQVASVSQGAEKLRQEIEEARQRRSSDREQKKK